MGLDGFRKSRERDSNRNNKNIAELGTVTSSGKEINVEGVGEYREVPLIAPFGIRWNPPSGASVQLIKNWSNGSNIVAVGTVVDKELEPGEIELYSLGGATIKLRNDGTVLINEHFLIKEDGYTERI